MSFKHNFCNSTSGTARTERQNVCLRIESSFHIFSMLAHHPKLISFFVSKTHENLKHSETTKMTRQKQPTQPSSYLHSIFQDLFWKLWPQLMRASMHETKLSQLIFIFVAITKSGFQRCIKSNYHNNDKLFWLCMLILWVACNNSPLIFGLS